METMSYDSSWSHFFLFLGDLYLCLDDSVRCLVVSDPSVCWLVDPATYFPQAASASFLGEAVEGKNAKINK